MSFIFSHNKTFWCPFVMPHTKDKHSLFYLRWKAWIEGDLGNRASNGQGGLSKSIWGIGSTRMFVVYISLSKETNLRSSVFVWDLAFTVRVKDIFIYVESNLSINVKGAYSLVISLISYILWSFLSDKLVTSLSSVMSCRSYRIIGDKFSKTVDP